MRTMTTPAPVHPSDLRDVTVVVRVGDHAATLAACLDSLLEQSIGPGRVEIVAVDDGSVDDGPALLSRYAGARPDLVLAGRLPAGTGPAAARNWAMSQAGGRYVIFLEGSDRLAPDALERLVASADRNESDVVLGKQGGEYRAPVPGAVFRRDRAHADLYDSRVFWTLSPDKLFRTDLLRRRALEFPADLPAGSESVFTSAAFLTADAVSVVADAPCVFPGPPSFPSPAPLDRVGLAARLMHLVCSLVPAGPRRDFLLSRHLEVELGAATTGAPVSGGGDVRESTQWAARDVLHTYLTPGAHALLPKPLAVRFALLLSGRFAEADRMAAYETDTSRPGPRKTVEHGRVFTTLPFFRDPETGLPDDLFDITDRMTVRHQLTSAKWTGSILGLEGFAFFDQLSTRDRNTKVVLRERTSGAEERFSVTARRDETLVNSKGKPRAMGRFSTRVNFRQTSSGWPVPAGIWDLYLAVSFEGVTQEVRAGRERSDEVDTMSRLPVVIAPSPGSEGHELVATPFYTEEGHLSVEVAQRLPVPGRG